MAELGEFFVSNETKVHVDIDMLDYGYIENCNDANKLQAIVEILQSGREGYYPDLTEKAEMKLLSVLPEKDRKRILRMKQKVTPSEIAEAGHELNEWENDIERMDAELRSKEKAGSTKTKSALPPIRGTKVEKLDVPSKTSKPRHAEEKKKEDVPKRLSGYDFPAWEKFDVDAELKKLEEEETAAEREKRLAREEGRRKAEEAARKRAKRHQEELNVFREEMKSQDMTALQRQTIAAREKQKGNEAFRAGENDEAYAFYSRSLALDNTSLASAVVYANRSVVSIRLNKLESAEEDADRALQLDPTYVKALSRRGLARLKLGKTGPAIEDFQRALELKPGNGELSQLLKKAKDKYLEVEGRPYGTERLLSNSTSEYSIPFKTVHSKERLLLPKSDFRVQQSGVLLELRPEEPQYTRIQIEESDSEDEGNSTEVREESSGFTRIAIEMSDEECDDKVNQNVSECFTRIAITMSSDSEEDETEHKGKEEEKNLELKSIAEKERGNSLMQKGDIKGALNAYNESLRLSPSGQVSTAVHSNRALAHIKLQNFRDAVADTGLVLVRDPSNVKALYRRSMAYEALKDFDRALADIKQVLKLEPANDLALKSQERLLLEMKWSPKEESNCICHENDPGVQQEIKAQSVQTVEQLRMTASHHLDNGDYNKAVEAIQMALGQDECSNMTSAETIVLQHMLATAYTALEQREDALNTLKEILSEDGNDLKAMLRIGEIYLEMNDAEQAKQYAESALRIDPTDCESLVLMNSIELHQERSRSSTLCKKEESQEGSAETDESKKKRSIQKKNAGNDAMKAKDYPLAVQLYSEAIGLDPTNSLIYNNRAQAYLKMSDYVNAEKDSTFVIDSSGNPPNLKALYRRSLARKGMGDKMSLMKALEDLGSIIKSEPANKEAKLERSRIQNMLSGVLNEEKASLTAAASVTEQRKSQPSDNTGMVALSTKMKTPNKLSSVMKKEDDQCESDSLTVSKSLNTQVDSPASCPSLTPKSTPTTVKKVVVKNPVVPTEPPKTVYELERVWRGLKNRPELFAVYLTTFKRSTFKKVIKETVSPDLLSCMLFSVRDHLLRTHTASAFNVLEGLASTPKFDMILSILPSEDLACVVSCMEHLAAHVDRERAEKLRRLYNL